MPHWSVLPELWRVFVSLSEFKNTWLGPQFYSEKNAHYSDSSVVDLKKTLGWKSGISQWECNCCYGLKAYWEEGLVYGNMQLSRFPDTPWKEEEQFLLPSPHFPVGTKPEQPDLLHLLFTWLAANVSQVSTGVDGLLTNQKVRSANLQCWLPASLPIKGFQMVTEPLTLMKTATKTLPQAPAPATIFLLLCCRQILLFCFFFQKAHIQNMQWWGLSTH